ncbi:MAG TPA: PepSY domain-containing protein, partial [Allosphingosinicella sp.]
RAMALAEARGMSAPWMLAIPAAPGAPYQFSRAAERANEAHVLYLDAASGAVLQDAAYAGFGGGAQAIEWGIYTHQGQQYGEINRLVMLTGCIGVLLLAASAPIMWWKRRRRGRLDAPPSASPRQTRVVAALMVAGGVLLPLTGLTMLAALAGEMAWRRWGPGPAGAAA